MPAHVQTKTEIRAVFEALGVRPRKRFGQNFLIDGNLMRRLAAAAELGPGDVVLEVGAGTGGLTDLLVESAGRVVAVEIDRALAEFLRERFAGRANFTLIEGDVLHGKNRLAAPVVEAVKQAAADVAARRAAGDTGPGTAGVSRRAALVANLPYSVATPLLMNLLQELPVVSRLCFTVQRDVAEKIEAAPRTKAYGPLSIVLQAAAAIRRVAQVPASAFWPEPGVESTMLRLDVDRRHLARPLEVARFTALLRDAFGHRRKTLRYNLSPCLSEEGLAAAAEAFDLSRRPEDLSVDEWLTLARRTVLRP